MFNDTTKYSYDGLHVRMDVLIWMPKVHHKHIWVPHKWSEEDTKKYLIIIKVYLLWYQTTWNNNGINKEPKKLKE